MKMKLYIILYYIGKMQNETENLAIQRAYLMKIVRENKINSK